MLSEILDQFLPKNKSTLDENDSKMLRKKLKKIKKKLLKNE
jgi:hypothetical protein